MNKQCKTDFQSGYTIFILINNEWQFLLLQVLTSNWFCQRWDFSYCHRCVVVCRCCFDLNFSIDKWCWPSFPVFICHLHSFLDEVSIFCPIFNCRFLIVNFKELLVYFGYNYLFWIHVLEHFSQSVACLLTLLIVSYTELLLLLSRFSCVRLCVTP